MHKGDNNWKYICICRVIVKKSSPKNLSADRFCPKYRLPVGRQWTDSQPTGVHHFQGNTCLKSAEISRKYTSAVRALDSQSSHGSEIFLPQFLLTCRTGHTRKVGLIIDYNFHVNYCYLYQSGLFSISFKMK